MSENTDAIVDIKDLIELCAFSSKELFDTDPEVCVKKFWNIFISNFWTWYDNPEIEKDIKELAFLLKIVLNIEVAKLLRVNTRFDETRSVESLVENKNLYQWIMKFLLQDEHYRHYLTSIIGFVVWEEDNQLLIDERSDDDDDLENYVFENLTIIQETYIEDMCFLIELLEGNIKKDEKGERYVEVLTLEDCDIMKKQKFLYV